jgi:hypothetical protein
MPKVPLPPNWKSLGRMEKEAYMLEQTKLLLPPVHSKNAALAFGALGGALGLALGFAGGLARRSMRSALLAAFAGLILGAVAGAAMSVLMVPVFLRQVDPEGGPLMPSVTLGGIWAVVGAVGGLALGLGLGGKGTVARALLGGFLGAIAGTALYMVINAFAFPLERGEEPIPDSSVARFFIHLTIALGTAAGAAILARGLSAKSRTPRHPLSA